MSRLRKGPLAGKPAVDAEANARAQDGKKVIIVLERCALETVKTKRGYELLTADTHRAILRKYNKNAQDYRPDITHRCLLTLLDSPLNKAGLLQIYMHTTSNVLIQVNPHLRIPRTFKRFCGLMIQLLHKLKIRASNGPDVLLKVIKGPVTKHLPPGALKIATEVGGELVAMREFAATLPDDKPVVFTVGSQAHGDAIVDWTERTISVSQYPLSASVALSRITSGFEDKWGIL